MTQKVVDWEKVKLTYVLADEVSLPLIARLFGVPLPELRKRVKEGWEKEREEVLRQFETDVFNELREYLVDLKTRQLRQLYTVRAHLWHEIEDRLCKNEDFLDPKNLSLGNLVKLLLEVMKGERETVVTKQDGPQKITELPDLSKMTDAELIAFASAQTAQVSDVEKEA